MNPFLGVFFRGIEGLNVPFLGMSMALGLTAVFGTLIPPIFSGQILEVIITHSGQITFTGIFIGITGIIIVSQAGFLKDRQLTIVDGLSTGINLTNQFDPLLYY
jgi:hypothetical protein